MADHMIFGVCKFCGQSQTLKSSEMLEGDDANEYITKHCKCEKALKARYIDQIGRDVEFVAGDECREYGYCPQSHAVTELLLSIATCVFDCEIDKASITLDCGDTVSIKPKGGAVQIMRTKCKERITPEGPVM